MCERRLDRTLEGITGGFREVSAVALSPDGKMLVIGSAYGGLNIFDLRTGRWKAMSGHTWDVLAIAFSRDGRMLATGSAEEESGKNMRLWDAHTGRQQRALRGHTDDVYSVAFTPDGKTVASGSKDRTLKVWDARSGLLTRTIEHPEAVWSLAYSPNGRWLASASDRLYVWDARTGVLQRTFEDSAGAVRLVFLGDHSVVSTRVDGRVGIWDRNTGRLKATFLVVVARQGTRLTSDWIAFTPDGFYHGSAGVTRFIGWRVRNEAVSAKAGARVYHRPDLVRRALRGER